ncbi:hypothetical protein SIM20_28570, partial [Bacillus cereus group sp. BfR-BA-02570]|uniref:hypothetical protein n=1 Tax=Bacillus cereus group sp. BfR-BA-02570 TaxID=3094890 RepID=UPI0029C32A46
VNKNAIVLYDDSVFIFTYNAKYYLKQAQNNSKSDTFVIKSVYRPTSKLMVKSECRKGDFFG